VPARFAVPHHLIDGVAEFRLPRHRSVTGLRWTVVLQACTRSASCDHAGTPTLGTGTQRAVPSGRLSVVDDIDDERIKDYVVVQHFGITGRGGASEVCRRHQADRC
jgi:hypothetical protein